MPTIPEILMAQASVTQTLFLKGPKRLRELPKPMNLLGAFSSALTHVLGPAYSPGTFPRQGLGSGPESRPAPGLTCCCPMSLQDAGCQMPRQFYFPPGCRVLRATVRLRHFRFTQSQASSSPLL
uniref:Uncharacterized protein n=1 Tax=Pipistrellus kuhlii TaxID=59472 RepID=A0A7J7X0E7_PIPKU|nr:hypothetical protein mPipKuh1_010767 [Pipistrellus kuhlii]